MRALLAIASVALACLAPSALGATYFWARTGVVPGGTGVPGLGDAGFVECDNVFSLTPASCAFGGLGGAIFDVSPLGSAFAHGTCEAHSPSAILAGSLHFACGTDRDDDTFVTTVDATLSNDADGYDDELAEGSAPFFGTGSVLALPVCFTRDRDDSALPNAPGGDWDDVYAFAGGDGFNVPYTGALDVFLSLAEDTDCDGADRSGHTNDDFTGGWGGGSGASSEEFATLLWTDDLCSQGIDAGHAGACGINGCPSGLTSPPSGNQIAVVCGIPVSNPADGTGVVNCGDYNAAHGNPYPGQNLGEVLDLAPPGPGGGDVAACVG